jgi:hypothetical protein
MKKLFVHLSMLALLAALLVPMVGCNKEEKTEEETPPATSATPAPAETSPAMTSDMGGSMGTDMGGGTSAPMGSDMAPKK